MAEQNQEQWESLLTGPPPGRKFLAASMYPGTDIAVLNRMFSEICGPNMRLDFSQRVYLFMSFNEGVPNRELCRGYMLLLAANNIVVRREGSLLIVTDKTTQKARPIKGDK